MIPGNDFNMERLSVVETKSMCLAPGIKVNWFPLAEHCVLIDATDMFRYWKWNTYARPQCLDCRKETLIWISDLRKKA